MTGMLTLSDWFYRLLLALYPADFRREYGSQMAQVFHDQCRAAHGQGIAALGVLWWRTLHDVTVTVVIEHLASRKAGLMNMTTFKNHPDRLASLLFLIPGLLLSLFYLLTIYNGETAGYLLAALAGVAGFGLSFLKIMRRVRIWEQFFLGFAIGAVSFLIPLIWMPMMNLGIPALRLEPWPTVRLALAIAVSLLAVWLLGRWTGRHRRLYGIVAAIVLVNGLIRALLTVGPNEYPLWNLSWTWGYSAAVLGIVVVGFRLSRQFGLPTLLAVLVGLGTMNSVNLTMADIAEGRTPYGQIMLLLAYIFPLVICPAWLLFAPTWRQKKLGVLLSWGMMLVAVVLVLPVVDGFLVTRYYIYFRPVDILGNILAYGAPFIGLWLALTLYEKALVEATILPPSNNSPAGTAGDSHDQLSRAARSS